jgi:hypothetical protein
VTPMQQTKQPLNLRINDKVLVDVEGSGKRFWTEAYGMVRDEFILLRHPMSVAFKDLLNPQQPVTARFMTADGSIFGFKSSVVGTIARPTPILVLTHPFVVETVNLRRHDRVDCFLPATLFHEGNELPGYIVNLSVGGSKFVYQPGGDGSAAPLDMPADSEAFCQFRLPGQEAELYARSIVKSTTQAGKKVVVGLKFEDVEEASREAILDYVRSAQEFMAS